MLVEALKIVEDEQEIGVLMRGAGRPLDGLSGRMRDRLRQRTRTNHGRAEVWRNIQRIASSLQYCHEAGIVHGKIGEAAIFTDGAEQPDFRLGGYEDCVHIASVDSVGSAGLTGTRGVISFRNDWSSLGVVASSLLGVDDSEGHVLLPGERSLLDRLRKPPRFENFDGKSVLDEIEVLVGDLERIGSSDRNELIAFPDRGALRSDLPSLVAGAIAADDTDALIRFLAEDIAGARTRAVVNPIGKSDILLVTDLGTYKIKLDSSDDRIGRIVGCARRRSDDPAPYAVDFPQRIHLCANRKTAHERRRTSGGGAISWRAIGQFGDREPVGDELPEWHALLLIEAFSLLATQFRHYPVEIIDVPGSDLVWVVAREDAARDERRAIVNRPPAADALEREMQQDDERTEWTLTRSEALSLGPRAPKLALVKISSISGRRAYAFHADEPVRPTRYMFLRPRPDQGTERAIRRRLRYIAAARGNTDLLRAIDDPSRVALDDVLRGVASPGNAPADMDASKEEAWSSIATGRSLNVVVGPPGVGKTFLVSHLVRSILDGAPNARILISAQNHDALAQMERKLLETLPIEARIIVRVERQLDDVEDTTLRRNSKDLLRTMIRNDSSDLTRAQRRQVAQTLESEDGHVDAGTDAILRDTDHLFLRSADVTLTTANSFLVEEMIENGEQFDWVIVEEAARASGPELVGPLLLGNRRVLIGDHHQLAPFEAEQRTRLYDDGPAAILLKDAVAQFEAIPDLPPETIASLKVLHDDSMLREDVLATAARLEEPFRTIAEREEERLRERTSYSSAMSMLVEQSRMHPTICELVSNTFYDGRLHSSERVFRRESTINTTRDLFAAPVIVLDLPSLSISRRRAFESRRPRPYTNAAEVDAILQALGHLVPVPPSKVSSYPTLAILSPYASQVHLLGQRLNRLIDSKNGTLFGFTSPKGDGRFIHTVDGFQGSEADLVVISLVRNNADVGPRALGFLRNRQRMNVLLSRAKQKLILATSRRFLTNAVDGIDPGREGAGTIQFVRVLLEEINRISEKTLPDGMPGASIVEFDEQGQMVS